MTKIATPLVPCSWGEVIDKLSILEIKQNQISDPNALKNIAAEFQLLKQIADQAFALDASLDEIYRDLLVVNQKIWDVEEYIRQKEASADFGHSFIELARAVYTNNDQRAILKRRINAILESELIEEKSHASINQS